MSAAASLELAPGAPPERTRGGFAFGAGPARVAVAGRALMAPMMGYNEQALRRICRRFGSGLAVTEMVKPEKLLRGDPEVLRDLAFGDDERPLGVQLAMRELDLLLPALGELLGRGFDFVDLNMGCPLQKECAKGFGAALLRDPARVFRLVEAVVRAAPCPVSVKVRAGYELGELLAPDVVRAALDAGAALVCVHGRTKMGWYKEPSDPGAIARVVEAVAGRVPVIGNGDVTSLESALEMLARTGCDAVMVGRGAVGNPWLFREIDRYLQAGEVLAPPGFEDVRAVFREHAGEVLALMGPRAGHTQVRRYAFYYFGRYGLDGPWRARVASTRRFEELELVLDELSRSAAGAPPRRSGPGVGGAAAEG